MHANWIVCRPAEFQARGIPDAAARSSADEAPFSGAQSTGAPSQTGIQADTRSRMVITCLASSGSACRVVDVRELLYQPRRELRQMLHETHVAALLGRTRGPCLHPLGGSTALERADHRAASASFRASKDRDRSPCRKLTRADHRVVRIVSITSSSLPQREPTICRRSAIIGAESACGPVAQLVRAEDS